MSFKKLDSGAALPTSVPATNQASCENRASALKTSRSFSRQFQTSAKTSNNSRCLSSNFDCKSDVSPIRQMTSEDFTAPTKEERQIAKSLVIQKMAQISAIQSSESAGPKYTVTADIFGQKLSMLIDSGSQVNIISADHCPSEILTCLSPSSLSISAYNESSVPVLGTFKTDVKLGNIFIREALIHVTRNNFRPILGTPALKHLTLNFKNGSISNGEFKVKMEKRDFHISAENFNLQASTTKEPRRQFRLFSSTTTTIPPRHEAVLPVRIENSFSGYGFFITEPAKSCMEGCSVAKSLSFFTKSSRNSVIRVLNPANFPLKIKNRSPLVNVVAVDAIAPKPVTSSNKVIENLTIGAVPEPVHLEIKTLLEEFSDTFASELTPLGETQNVEFDVDTGNSPPVAQQKYRTPYFLRSIFNARREPDF